MTGTRLTNLPAMTRKRMNQLMHAAKRISSTGDLVADLDRLAKLEGFLSWELLMAKAGARDLVDETKRAVPSAGADQRAQRHADYVTRSDTKSKGDEHG